MFIFYRGNIISVEGLKRVFYYSTGSTMKFEYDKEYNIYVECPKKEAEADLQKIFEMLEKKA